MKRLTAFVGLAVLVALGASGCGDSTTSPNSIVEKPSRAVSDGPTEVPAAIAGNVADADHDGAGDNHNALPGPAPVLTSAGVDELGGPGSNGTVRIHAEWGIASFSGYHVVTAEARFHTLKGSVDVLDTQFFALSADGNGTLEDTDFESPGAPITGAVMPVPPDPGGTEGTFVFDVTNELQTAIDAGFSYFSIQGRVDEGLSGGGPQRGLQVRSTATSNITDGKTPTLIIVFAPVVIIDVKPGSYPNSINPGSHGVIPVAILGSSSFDVGQVDDATLRFGPAEAPIAHHHGHFDDVNNDGFVDLVVHFRTQETGITAGDTEACLSGQTLEGTPFEACDSVRTVPPGAPPAVPPAGGRGARLSW